MKNVLSWVFQFALASPQIPIPMPVLIYLVILKI